MKKILSIIIPGGIIAIVLFPYAPSRFTQYGIWSAYFALLIFFILWMPVVIFLVKSYWNSTITVFLWFLRFLMIADFLIVGLLSGISGADILSVSGTLFLTFFYEMGYLVAASDYTEKIIKYWVWLNIFICVILLPVLIYLFLGKGISGIIYENLEINKYIINWPNEFGLSVAIAFLLAAYFFQKNWKYGIAPLVILPIMVLADSKGAFLGLLAGLSIVGLRIFKKEKAIILLLFVTLFIVSGFILFNDKNLPGGSQIDHSYNVRFWRWKTYIDVWEKSPILGYGFKSFTSIIPEFYYQPTDNWAATGSSHNDYLDILVRGGLIYFSFFWLFALFVIKTGFRMAYSKINFKINNLMLFLSCSLVAILIASIFQNPIKDPIISFYFWSVVAIIAYYKNAYYKEQFKASKNIY